MKFNNENETEFGKDNIFLRKIYKFIRSLWYVFRLGYNMFFFTCYITGFIRTAKNIIKNFIFLILLLQN